MSLLICEFPASVEFTRQKWRLLSLFFISEMIDVTEIEACIVCILFESFFILIWELKKR